MMARCHFRTGELLRESSFWKQLLARAFLFQCDCFGRAEPGGKKNLVVAIALGINNFSYHSVIELKNFRGRLHASGVSFTLGSVHGYFHKTSSRAFKKLMRMRCLARDKYQAHRRAVGPRSIQKFFSSYLQAGKPATLETLSIWQQEQAQVGESL